MAEIANPLWEGLKQALDARGIRHVADWPLGAHVSLFWQADRYLVLGAYNSRPPNEWWGLQAIVVDPIIELGSSAVAVRFLFQNDAASSYLVTGPQLRAMLPELSVGAPKPTAGPRPDPISEALGLPPQPRTKGPPSPSYKIEPKHLPGAAPYLKGRAIVDALQAAISEAVSERTFDPTTLLHPDRRDRWRGRLALPLERLRVERASS
jgi:hypothetical protein